MFVDSEEGTIFFVEVIVGIDLCRGYYENWSLGRDLIRVLRWEGDVLERFGV